MSYMIRLRKGSVTGRRVGEFGPFATQKAAKKEAQIIVKTMPLADDIAVLVERVASKVGKHRVSKKLKKANPKASWAKSSVQSLLFSKRSYTKAKAKAWAKAHGYRYGTVDETSGYWHVVQKKPRGSVRTITFGKGIKAHVQGVAKRGTTRKKANPRSGWTKVKAGHYKHDKGSVKKLKKGWRGYAASGKGATIGPMGEPYHKTMTAAMRNVESGYFAKENPGRKKRRRSNPKKGRKTTKTAITNALKRKGHTVSSIREVLKKQKTRVDRMIAGGFTAKDIADVLVTYEPLSYKANPGKRRRRSNPVEPKKLGTLKSGLTAVTGDVYWAKDPFPMAMMRYGNAVYVDWDTGGPPDWLGYAATEATARKVLGRARAKATRQRKGGRRANPRGKTMEFLPGGKISIDGGKPFDPRQSPRAKKARRALKRKTPWSNYVRQWLEAEAKADHSGAKYVWSNLIFKSGSSDALKREAFRALKAIDPFMWENSISPYKAGSKKRANRSGQPLSPYQRFAKAELGKLKKKGIIGPAAMKLVGAAWRRQK